jgi:tetratricopeptide (TPR) repeat protein
MLRVFPHKSDVAEALKNLSARKTLEEDYGAVAEGQGSYRDILKDKEEAVQLEQEKREVKSEDVADRLIRENEQRLVRDSKNFKLIRTTAELYAQKKDFAKAIEYADRIRAEGAADPSLDRFIADIQLKRFDHQLEQLDSNSPDYPELAARIQAERLDFRLNECKARADRYPSDLQIRFELGELYFQTGKITEAIGEFQKARSNPARKVASIGYLAQCYARRNMNDLAARNFQEALKEKTAFDDEKKELIYQLGCTFEKMGKKEDAIEQFKQIYEVDIGYKDVAAKVDAFYAGN